MSTDSSGLSDEIVVEVDRGPVDEPAGDEPDGD